MSGDYTEVPLPLCICGQPPSPPVDNLPPRERDSTPFVEDKSSTERELIVDALTNSVDVLAARVEALELQYASFLGVLDRPLSPAESVKELRRLKEEALP